LEYRGDIPMYLLSEVNSGQYTQMYFDGKIKCYKEDEDGDLWVVTTLDNIPVYNERLDDL
jgi:hypothetical protein